MFNQHTISLKIYKIPTFCHPNEIDGCHSEWKLDCVFCNSSSYFWRLHHFTMKKILFWLKKNPIILICNIPRQHIVETYWDRIRSSVYIDKFDLNNHFISVFISYDITCTVHIHNSLNILFFYKDIISYYLGDCLEWNSLICVWFMAILPVWGKNKLKATIFILLSLISLFFPTGSYLSYSPLLTYFFISYNCKPLN